jgi:hypothetical protein
MKRDHRNCDAAVGAMQELVCGAYEENAKQNQNLLQKLLFPKDRRTLNGHKRLAWNCGGRLAQRQRHNTEVWNIISLESCCKGVWSQIRVLCSRTVHLVFDRARSEQHLRVQE